MLPSTANAMGSNSRGLTLKKHRSIIYIDRLGEIDLAIDFFWVRRLIR